MKEILLKIDGTLNEEGINEYIKIYGINTPLKDLDSIYHNQTPLFVAVSSDEINIDTKLKLVSYLLSKGADVNHINTKKNGGLLAIALHDQNLELADLLLKEKADLKDTYRNKNLIEIALKLKKEPVLLWVLRNAKDLFLLLEKEELDDYYQRIVKVFPELKDELNRHLKPIAEEKIHHKFDKLGLINSDDAALIIAAKTEEKTNKNPSYKNSIFVITEDDNDELIEQIKNLIENDTTQNLIKFQIVYFPGSHAIFGEFEIDKTKNPSTVKYFHCDPLPPIIKFYEIITSEFLKQIAPLANIEIYDSGMVLQRGLGCIYFSIDGAMMLATPPDRTYVTNVFKYMKEYGQENNNLFKETNVKYILSPTLPTRFIRGLQFIDAKQNINYNLNSLVFKTSEKNTIVNKKKETAEKVIRRDLKEKPAKFESNEMRTYNIRAERKMNQYGKSVLNFIKKKNIFEGEFYNLIDECKIKGLVQFCETKLVKKEVQKVKLK